MRHNAKKHLNPVLKAARSFSSDIGKLYEHEVWGGVLLACGATLGTYNLRHKEWLKEIFAFRRSGLWYMKKKTFEEIWQANSWVTL